MIFNWFFFFLWGACWTLTPIFNHFECFFITFKVCKLSNFISKLPGDGLRLVLNFATGGKLDRVLLNCYFWVTTFLFGLGYFQMPLNSRIILQWPIHNDSVVLICISFEDCPRILQVSCSWCWMGCVLCKHLYVLVLICYARDAIFHNLCLHLQLVYSFLLCHYHLLHVTWLHTHLLDLFLVVQSISDFKMGKHLLFAFNGRCQLCCWVCDILKITVLSLRVGALFQGVWPNCIHLALNCCGSTCLACHVAPPSLILFFNRLRAEFLTWNVLVSTKGRMVLLTILPHRCHIVLVGVFTRALSFSCLDWGHAYPGWWTFSTIQIDVLILTAPFGLDNVHWVASPSIRKQLGINRVASVSYGQHIDGRLIRALRLSTHLQNVWISCEPTASSRSSLFGHPVPNSFVYSLL